VVYNRVILITMANQ